MQVIALNRGFNNFILIGLSRSNVGFTTVPMTPHKTLRAYEQDSNSFWDIPFEGNAAFATYTGSSQTVHLNLNLTKRIVLIIKESFNYLKTALALHFNRNPNEKKQLEAKVAISQFKLNAGFFNQIVYDIFIISNEQLMESMEREVEECISVYDAIDPSIQCQSLHIAPTTF